MEESWSKMDQPKLRKWISLHRQWTTCFSSKYSLLSRPLSCFWSFFLICASLLANQSMPICLARCLHWACMSCWIASGSSGSVLSYKFVCLARLPMIVFFQWSFLALSGFFRAEPLQLVEWGCRAKWGCQFFKSSFISTLLSTTKIQPKLVLFT